MTMAIALLVVLWPGHGHSTFSSAMATNGFGHSTFCTMMFVNTSQASFLPCLYKYNPVQCLYLLQPQIHSALPLDPAVLLHVYTNTTLFSVYIFSNPRFVALCPWTPLYFSMFIPIQPCLVFISSPTPDSQRFAPGPRCTSPCVAIALLKTCRRPWVKPTRSNEYCRKWIFQTMLDGSSSTHKQTR